MPCGNSVLLYFSKTPQTAAGLGRRKISQLRTPGGVQASCAYRRTPVGRVQRCCQVCVCACVAVLYNALSSSSGMSFFIPGLNRPVCPVKNTIIDHFLLSQKTPWRHRRVKRLPNLEKSFIRMPWNISDELIALTRPKSGASLHPGQYRLKKNVFILYSPFVIRPVGV